MLSMDKTKPAYKALFWQVAENAVKTQIWISVCVYVLIAIVRKELKSELSLSQIIQILSVNVYQKEPLHQLLTKEACNLIEGESRKQLMLWD